MHFELFEKQMVESRLNSTVCNFNWLIDRRTDFGMIGFENRNSDKTELVFDQKCHEHVHSVELVFQSIQTNYLLLWFFISFVPIQYTDNSKFVLFSLSIFSQIFISGYFFDEYLQYITLNNNSVEFTKLDLTYLLKVCAHSIQSLQNSLSNYVHV